MGWGVRVGGATASFHASGRHRSCGHSTERDLAMRRLHPSNASKEARCGANRTPPPDLSAGHPPRAFLPPMPSSPDRTAALDALAERLDALDEAPLIARLDDATVDADLLALGLSAARLRPLADLAASASSAAPASRTADRPAVAHGAHGTTAPAQAVRRARMSRWRRGLAVAAGLALLVIASTVVMRPSGGAMEAGDAVGNTKSDLKSQTMPPPGVGAATPAAATQAAIARLDALVAAPSDTAGAAAAISTVRRAYADAAAFEVLAGRPLDPSLSADRLAALLGGAFDATGQPDSARAYRAR